MFRWQFNYTINKYRKVFIWKKFMSSSHNESQKILTVALLGSPNAGKSTLVNNMVGARVSAVSHIAHTTRAFANGILNYENTQLIFTDTPGVVSYHEGRRLKMSQTHVRSPRRVAASADILAVVTDVSYRKTKDYIDETILQILDENSHLPTVLIMNKVDMLRRKEDLLFLTSVLLQDRKKDQWGYLPYGGSSKFKEVFYTCARNGEGVEPLLNYLLLQAKPGQWEYSSDIFSDASVERHIAEVFREKMLLLFTHEIPWQFKQETLLFHNENDSVRIHQKLTWPKKSQRRYVLTKEAELTEMCCKELENMFECHVELTVDISQKDKMTVDDLISY